MGVSNTSRRKIMSVIGIIGAMEEEVAALKEKMQISGVLKRASMEFYKGTLQGTHPSETFLCCLVLPSFSAVLPYSASGVLF